MKALALVAVLFAGLVVSPALAQSRSAGAHPATATSYSGSAEFGQSHYSDGHTVIYSDEHVPAQRAGFSNTFGWPLAAHGSGHGGHSYANSRHDHHPYITLGR